MHNYEEEFSEDKLIPLLRGWGWDGSISADEFLTEYVSSAEEREWDRANLSGYESGREDGREIGWHDGYEIGYAEGYASGADTGY